MYIYVIWLINYLEKCENNPFDNRIQIYLNCPCMIQCLSLSHPICRWVEDGSLVDEDGGSFTNWRESQDEPNGGGGENCMAMFPDDGTWYDINCYDVYYHPVCSKPIASTATAAAHNISRARVAPPQSLLLPWKHRGGMVDKYLM